MSGDRCRECKAPLWWVKTAAGNLQPLDRDPNPDGNIVMRLHPESKSQRAYVLSTQPNLLDDEVRYMPHHATCPNVDRFRQPKRSSP